MGAVRDFMRHSTGTENDLRHHIRIRTSTYEPSRTDEIQSKNRWDVAREMYLKKCEEYGIYASPSEDDKEVIERYSRSFRKVGETEFDKAISEIIGGK